MDGSVMTAYLAACQRSATSLRTAPERSAFKRDPDYAAVVGNDTRKRDITQGFLKHLRKRHSEKAMAKRVAANDRYGRPVLHTFGGRTYSAGSLRFLQVAYEIGTPPAVIEIGGGYGGQRLLCSHIADYTIVDVPEALDLARAYLWLHKIPTTFIEAGQPVDVKPGTFFLSDFALTELETEEIDRYMDAIVSTCEQGRITCAAKDRDALLMRLVRHFTVQAQPEHPATSRHQNEVVTFVRLRTDERVDTLFEDEPAVSVSPALKDQTTLLIADKLRSSEPWAFSRWGDGEWSAVLGLGTENCDGQAYEPLRDGLRGILRSRPSYLLGLQPLAMKKFGTQIAAWLRANHLRLPWVHADVFHDLSKEGALLPFLEPLKDRKVIVVGPERLRGLMRLLPYVAFVEVPVTNAYAALWDITARLSAALVSVVRPVVAFSAGMVSNLLIHELSGREATLIDFGSVWDPYVGLATRNYHAAILQREGA